jgi:hypothetical protein
VDGVENQKQVFHAAHEPLEIAFAIPTFPQPRLATMEKFSKYKSKPKGD